MVSMNLAQKRGAPWDARGDIDGLAPCGVRAFMPGEFMGKRRSLVLLMSMLAGWLV
jgi:hypothetical protein